MEVLYTYQYTPCPFWLLILIGILTFALGFGVALLLVNPWTDKGWIAGIIAGILVAGIVIFVLISVGLTKPRTRKKVTMDKTHPYQKIEIEGYRVIEREGDIVVIEEIVE